VTQRHKDDAEETIAMRQWLSAQEQVVVLLYLCNFYFVSYENSWKRLFLYLSAASTEKCTILDCLRDSFNVK
jgi:hypothetical protein